MSYIFNYCKKLKIYISPVALLNQRYKYFCVLLRIMKLLSKSLLSNCISIAYKTRVPFNALVLKLGILLFKCWLYFIGQNGVLVHFCIFDILKVFVVHSLLTVAPLWRGWGGL